MSARLWTWAGVVAAFFAAAGWLYWCAVGAGPWGVALPPPALPTQSLVSSGDESEAVSIITGTRRQFGPPAMASAIVAAVRGSRAGRLPVWVDCVPGGTVAIGRQVSTWHPGGQGLPDRLGAELCRNHPLLEPRAAGGSWA